MQTSQVVWLGKGLLKYAVSFVLLLLLFRWVDFSVWQSVTLAVFIGVGYEAYLTVAAKATADESFSPYRVVVKPKFDELLLDYKLLKDVGEYNALCALWKKKDQRLISFTVLQLRASGDWLVYSDTDNCFLSDMNLEEPIEAIVFRGPRDTERAPVYLRDQSATEARLLSPSFYFRQGIGGYELGLKVWEDWWKEICAENPNEEFSRTKVDNNPIIGEAKLTIATIPNIAFTLFHVNRDYTSESRWWRDYRRIEKIRRAIDSQLALHGWERDQPNPNTDVRDPWIRIEHKYFRVQYREI